VGAERPAPRQGLVRWTKVFEDLGKCPFHHARLSHECLLDVLVHKLLDSSHMGSEAILG